MVEVFKTNVQEIDAARMLVKKLQEHFPGNRINFDLHDCDKILRIEGEDISPEEIIELVSAGGYHVEILI